MRKNCTTMMSPNGVLEKKYEGTQTEVELNILLRNVDPNDDRSIYVNKSIDNITIKGNYAYLGSNEGLQILDISNPSNPNKVGHYKTQNQINDIAIEGICVYITENEFGLRVIDISNIANPKEVGYYKINSTLILHLAVRKNFIYLTTQSDLFVLQHLFVNKGETNKK